MNPFLDSTIVDEAHCTCACGETALWVIVVPGVHLYLCADCLQHLYDTATPWCKQKEIA